MASTEEIDRLIENSLTLLAADPHVTQWRAKENNWVSYFAFKYLVAECRPNAFFNDPAQIGVEVSVPQAPGRRTRGVRRDIVIWPSAGLTCWGEGWSASCHPLVIMEWKVHIPGRKKRRIAQEREWLRDYCKKNRDVLAYAVEVDGIQRPPKIECCRFLDDKMMPGWLTLTCR